MSATKKALVAALAIGALALAGCGPVADKSSDAAKKSDTLTLLRTDAQASLQTAATKTSAAKSVAVAMTGTMAGQTMTATGAMAFEPLQAEMQMKILGQEMTSRLIGTVQYIQMGSGAKWMMLDLGKLAHSAGTDSAQLANQLKTMNPSTQIKALLGKGALKVVGEETIDGVKTVHYLSDMTAEQYVEAYGDPSKTADLKKGLKLAGDQKIKTELWVDEAYQVRKAHVASGTIMDMTMTYTDYGKPVNVVAPPASDVVDMAQMLNGLKPPA